MFIWIKYRWNKKYRFKFESQWKCCTRPCLCSFWKIRWIFSKKTKYLGYSGWDFNLREAGGKVTSHIDVKKLKIIKY